MRRELTAATRRVTERRKALARLVVLLVVAFVCPPLAGASSPAVWIIYLVLALGYSLLALRLIRSYSGDPRLGLLLCLTDGAILLPLLVWSSAAAMWVVLVALWAGGVVVTHVAGRATDKGTDRSPADAVSSRPSRFVDASIHRGAESLLEDALWARLDALRSTGTRFGLVLLRVLRFDDMSTYYGPDVSGKVLSAVGSRGLRLLGPDAQVFLLERGRVAFVFSTGTTGAGGAGDDRAAAEWIDPYDVESLAMALGRRVCEHLANGQKVECVVGWASAPADGTNSEDLLFAAESGAQSTAAFRRVAGSRVTVPDKARIAAG